MKLDRQVVPVLLGVVMLLACGKASPPAPQPGVLDGSAFVAVSRDLGLYSTAAIRSGSLRNLASTQLAAGRSFYLAIKRTSLQGRWFLTGFMEQTFPDGVAGGAASTVGTRVVSLKALDDRILLVDASDINAMSDAFDPTLVLEAWPVVTTSDTFNQDPARGDYILVDPSSGRAQVDVVGDGQVGTLNVEISFAQGFRRLADGAAFQIVFTGEASVPLHGNTGNELNGFRISGTLGIALRAYSEGEGFAPGPNPPAEYFFLSDPRLVKNQATVVRTPARWNIRRGMTPIRWTISPALREAQKDPFLSRYDLEGALRRGIEGWNQVFGHPVLEAVVGGPESTPGDDVTNYLYLDFNPRIGFAFANWRTNPNTGEIRGASVYLSTMWVALAAEMFDPGALPAGVDLAAPGSVDLAPRYVLGWAGMVPTPLCMRGFAPAALAAEGAALAVDPRTPQQKVADFVAAVVLHEVGHTLGLRHNFKGSLVPPSSSIMEYIDNHDQVDVHVPQRYDTQALQWLYGISTALPQDPFCNDAGTMVDPDCSRFDKGAAPMEDFYGALYDRQLLAYLTDASGAAPPDGSTMNGLLSYVRAGPTQAVRARAYHLALDRVTHAVPPGALPSRVDEMGALLNRRLWLSAAGERASRHNSVQVDPPIATDPFLNDLFLADEGGWWLRNVNGMTSFASRRQAVDVLKHVQSSSAYLELLDARADIAASFPAGTPIEPLTADLLSRIDVAVTPYFE